MSTLGKTDRKLKVGIVGCGFIANRRHLPAFLKSRNVQVTAVCDFDKKTSVQTSKRFNIPKAYTSLSSMLLREELDIVDVCTPPGAHASVAVAAMNQGCNVLIEKPMAHTVADCNQMISASKKNKVRLCVVHNQNFYPPFLEAQKAVKDGAIGRVIAMRVLSLTHKDNYLSQKNHWIHKLAGGVIGETGPHAVYMSLEFVEKVKEIVVHARKITSYPWVSFDSYNIQLIGDNITSSILISHAAENNTSEVNIFGTEGSINIDLQGMIMTRCRRENLKLPSIASSTLSMVSQTTNGVASNVLSYLLRRPMLGHDILIERFVNSIIHDQPIPVTAEEGRETVRIMEVIGNTITMNQYNEENEQEKKIVCCFST